MAFGGIQRVGSIWIATFDPSMLHVQMQVLGSGTAANQGPSDVFANDPNAVVAIDGPMFDSCGPHCGQILYRYIDVTRGIDIPSSRPGQGITFSVSAHTGVVSVLDGDQIPGDTSVAVQLYPTLIRGGAVQETADQNPDWRAGVALMGDGSLAFAVGYVPTMAAFARALLDAGAVEAGYTDGGSSTTLATPDGGFHGQGTPHVPGWLVAVQQSSSFVQQNTGLLAGAVVTAAAVAGASVYAWKKKIGPFAAL